MKSSAGFAIEELLLLSSNPASWLKKSHQALTMEHRLPEHRASSNLSRWVEQGLN